MFGIVQGGGYEDVRRRAVEETCALEFDGYAIGGLAVGEPKPLMLDLLEFTAALLPKDRPRYLMGVGTPPDLLDAVASGVDLFDCVLPTRNARNGQLFTAAGALTIKQARYATDPRPIEEGCACYTCRTFSRAYLRHLVIAREITGLRLTTLHNLHFMLETMRCIRQSILDGTFAAYKTEFLSAYETVN